MASHLMTRAKLEPASAFGRHPLQPHQLIDRVTRTQDVIVLCHLGIPRLDPNAWSLTIDGLLRRPMHLTLDALKSRQRTEIVSVHQCCGSPLEPETPKRRIANVVWGGARLSDILTDTEPGPNARFVWAQGVDYGVFQGVTCDSFLKEFPVARAAADVLIAYEMNGAPLSAEHGFPARLVIPGFYGTNSVKWLTRLTLADRRARGPFTTRWYNDPVRDAEGRATGATTPVWSIAPESLIVSPAPDEVLTAGKGVEIWGWAWADEGATAVDVSTDGGASWHPTALEPPAGRAWQRFAAPWHPEHRGAHEVCARAHAPDGRCQPIAGARNAVHRVSVKVQ
jgi:DMSO/TMAO reductase YedYZ molybdopterin-dependent catalytic subunit